MEKLGKWSLIGGDKVYLIGNVNCDALDTGTDEEVIESATYALRHGMPGGGYIFSTSNCFTRVCSWNATS